MITSVYEQSSLTVEKVMVTPQLASQWLRLNVRNRPLAKHQVARLSELMRRGDFVFNGDAIRFGVDGKLKDGQHRLTACVQSGCSFETLVVSGIEDDAFDTIDTFIKPRGVADFLALEGQKHANFVAATAKAVYNFCMLDGFFHEGCTATRLAFTPKLCIDLLNKRPGIKKAALDVKSAKCCKVFPSGATFAAMLYLFRSVEEALAEDFFDVMNNGSSNTKRAFNVLRETLIARRLSSTAIKKTAAVSLTIRAWNAEYAGRTVKILRFSSGEEFPKIAGINYENLGILIGADG